MLRRLPLLALPLLTLLLGSPVACGSDSESGDPPAIPYVGAPGVTINQVAIYQGLKRTLMLDGAPQGSNIPLVVGRDALVRVFYTTDPGYDGQEVTGQLRIAGQAPIESTGLLGPGSNDGDIASTINFTVPGAMVQNPFDYSVTIAQDGSTRNDNPLAHHPQGGATELVGVDGPQNTLRVVLVPFAYNADGSGRLPNTGPEQVEKVRQRFLGMYPVSNVEVSVREPVPTNLVISPTGAGFTEVGIELYGLRSNDAPADDVYYYGLFNPADSFHSYCMGGCVLGVTVVNENPPDAGSVVLRLAVGVGFEGYAADTAIHELGHSHGLYHAPCGMGLDPSSIDNAYPHAGGLIGVWGFDPLTGALQPPDQITDMMGYCDSVWISDYHYNKLFTRSVNVNVPDWHPPSADPLRYQLIAVDGTAKATFELESERRRPLAGKPVTVTARLGDGAIEHLDGRFVHYDHLPGGWLFVPVPAAAKLDRAEFTIGGRQVVAER